MNWHSISSHLVNYLINYLVFWILQGILNARLVIVLANPLSVMEVVTALMRVMKHNVNLNILTENIVLQMVNLNVTITSALIQSKLASF